MDRGGTDPSAETPEDLLDVIEAAKGWSEADRRAYFDRLVGKFSAESWRECVRTRLDRLDSPAAEAILRIVEIYGDADLFDRLVDTLRTREDLPLERVWEAFEVLDGVGLLQDHADLMERRDELVEWLTTEREIVDELAETLESDADGPEIVAKALERIEPEVREEVLEDLARRGPLGSGARSLFEALGNSADPAIRELASRFLIKPAENETENAIVRSDSLASLSTTLDGDGRGWIALVRRDDRGTAAAAFLCDVIDGVVAVVEDLGEDPDAFLAELAARPEHDSILGEQALALALLGGSLAIQEPNPQVSGLVARIIGPDFQAKPFLAPTIDDCSDDATFELDRVRELLDACGDWRDDSPLVERLAEEIALREGSFVPDPIRDAGSYRYFFEHRLGDRLERYARMFIWTAAFWNERGEERLARSAIALANRLIDPQHAVPGHPFAVEWTTRAFARALERLRTRSHQEIDKTSG